MKHLPAIDGLRAIAVLAVVAYHAGLPVPAGFVGVDVFFVISGYVITRMLAAEHRQTGAIDLWGFYARRARRILPALLVVVAVTLALSAALLSADAAIAVTRSAMAAMAMVPNVHFQLNSGGYFEVTADHMPLLHLWSLGVEEQFYLFWPLLLIVCRRRPWALAVLAVASLALAEYWLGVNREVSFYQMPARFWELAAGGLVALLPASRLGRITSALGLTAIGFAVSTEAKDFPGIGAALPVFGTALVLHAIHSGTRIAPLEWRPVRWIGLVSYSLYLWHWPLLALNRAASLDPPEQYERLLLCGLAFVLAALSYRYVETPFRKAQAPKAKVIGASVLACVALAGCAGAMGAAIPTTDLAARTRADFREVDPCHQQIDDAPALPAASCGDGDVVLWGDSHAYAWRPYAERFGSVSLLTRAACPPSLGGSDDLCAQFAGLAVERAKQGRVVVLAARWSIYDPAKADIAATLDVLKGVPRVIVMGPIPDMPYHPATCIKRRRIHRCTRTRAWFDGQAEPVRALLREAVRRHPNAEYVETAGYFCNAIDCPLLRDGYSLYWDNDHITISAARNFARYSHAEKPEGGEYD